MLATYFWLIKPGIVCGNSLAAAAGFMLGSDGRFRPGLMAYSLTGLALIVAAAGVLNNIIDRRIDRKMSRTSRRALARGSVEVPAALIYAAGLGLAGSLLLGSLANFLALALALFGLVAYVVLYGYFKRLTPYGTLVGSVAGAMPPVIGYVAASGRLDLGAGLLFLVLFTWQMPHFYAISLFRLKDYQAASLPVLPAKKGPRATKIRIVVYMAAFLAAAAALYVFGYGGYVYLVAMSLLGGYWLVLGLSGLQKTSDRPWARRVFKFSLVILLSFSVLVSLGSILP